ncbi:MAG: sugar phosphate isomerase/epimerase family protein [Terriglobia bacterium]
MSKHVSRREFLSSAATLATAVPILASAAPAPRRGPFRGTLCFFSKPVPQLNWRELAVSAKNAGFGGIDLTVRRHGHVLPERVATDLPRAVADIRDAGLEVPMITTELHSADDPAAESIISTASKLSIPYLKPGYYRYKYVNVVKELDEAGQKFRGLVALAGKHRVQVGYHNHPRCVGAPVWDLAKILEPIDPRWSGYYFDLGHATGDGGESCWKISTNLVMPRLKIIGARDIIWRTEGPHQWRVDDCAIGQGMCHWNEFLRTLAQSNFHGPVSLHIEYGVPGVMNKEGIAVSRAKAPDVMAVAKANLDSLKSLLREAYEEA